MSNLFLVLLIVITSLINESDQDVKSYPFKSGMIKYEIEGRVTGAEIIYYDDFGSHLYEMKTACYNEAGPKLCDTIIRIICSDTIMVLNSLDYTARGYLQKDTAINCRRNIVSVEMLQNMGYYNTGTDKVCGIPCEIYTGENGTMWVWNNIILKSEMIIMGIQMKMEAVEMLTEIKIPKSKFKLPRKYKLINL